MNEIELEIGSADPFVGGRRRSERDVTADAADAGDVRRHDGVARAVRSIGRSHPRQRRSRDADCPADTGITSGDATGDAGVGTPSRTARGSRIG